jgi:hypothetical protein
MPCAVCQESNEHTVRFIVDVAGEMVKDLEAAANEETHLNPQKDS